MCFVDLIILFLYVVFARLCRYGLSIKLCPIFFVEYSIQIAHTVIDSQYKLSNNLISKHLVKLLFWSLTRVFKIQLKV